jgi:hypothetical protein
MVSLVKALHLGVQMLPVADLRIDSVTDQLDAYAEQARLTCVASVAGSRETGGVTTRRYRSTSAVKIEAFARDVAALLRSSGFCVADEVHGQQREDWQMLPGRAYLQHQAA